jgi:alanyl-tRNA synthetase
LSAIRRVLGKHIWQAGAEKTPQYSRLDVTHYKLPSIEELKMIEMEANRIIAEDREVRVKIMERGEAEKKYGPVIYQGGVVPGKYLRIIEVDGWDVEACGGTHVKRTSELLYIKIDRVEKIHDGVIRFVFRVGEEAVRYMWNYYEISEKLKNILSTSLNDLIDKVNSLLEEIKKDREYITRLEKTIIKYKAEGLIARSIYVNNLRVIIEESDSVDESIMISEEIDRRMDDYIFIGYAKKGRGVNIIVKLGDGCISKGLSALDIVNVLRTEVLKGGGKGDVKYARIGGTGKVTKDILLEVVRKYVGKRY